MGAHHLAFIHWHIQQTFAVCILRILSRPSRQRGSQDKMTCHLTILKFMSLMQREFCPLGYKLLRPPSSVSFTSAGLVSMMMPVT